MAIFHHYGTLRSPITLICNLLSALPEKLASQVILNSMINMVTYMWHLLLDLKKYGGIQFGALTTHFNFNFNYSSTMNLISVGHSTWYVQWIERTALKNVRSNLALPLNGLPNMSAPNIFLFSSVISEFLFPQISVQVLPIILFKWKEKYLTEKL